MTDTARIVGGLTDDLRARLKNGTWNVRHAADQLVEIGVLKWSPPHFVELTPLGLQVRQTLQHRKDG